MVKTIGFILTTGNHPRHGGRLSATRSAAHGTILQFTLPAATER